MDRLKSNIHAKQMFTASDGSIHPTIELALYRENGLPCKKALHRSERVPVVLHNIIMEWMAENKEAVRNYLTGLEDIYSDNNED